MILIDKELQSIVNKEIPKPGEHSPIAEQLNWKTRADKAMATIILAMSTSELVHINNITNPIEIWKKLQTIYESKGTTSKHFLL